MGESLKLKYLPSTNLIKVINMNNLISWLMGDTLGRSVINTWNWLWQISVGPPKTTSKTSDNITLEHATQLYSSIASRVLEMQKAVDRMRQITLEIKRRYDLKSQEHQKLVGLALAYKRTGEIVEARMAMATAIGIEGILPELHTKLENAQEMLISINEFYAQEKAKLDLLEIEMEEIRATIEMNKSMGGNYDLDKFNDLTNLQEKFRVIQTETEDRYRQIQVMSQLSNQSNDNLDKKLNIRDIDERIKSLGN